MPAAPRASLERTDDERARPGVVKVNAEMTATLDH
jgi:hypothetical protein